MAQPPMACLPMAVADRGGLAGGEMAEGSPMTGRERAVADGGDMGHPVGAVCTGIPPPTAGGPASFGVSL